MNRSAKARREEVAGLAEAELRARLLEAEETLDAIRFGEVDAVVVGGPQGQQVYTLTNADRPYRALVEKMQEGAFTLSAEGLIVYANDRLSDMLGLAPDTLAASPATRMFDAANAAAFVAMLDRLPTAGGLGGGDLFLAAASGAAVPVHVSLTELPVEHEEPRLVCGVVTDLTGPRRRSDEMAAANARLASEIEERRRAEDTLQLALSAAGMGSWHLDLATGQIERSPRHDEILGYPDGAPAWTLQIAFDHFVADDQDAVRAAYEAARKSGKIDFEKRIRRASDGLERWIHVEGHTYVEGGRAVRIAGVVADVTDRRLLDEQLRQSQKMEAVGQLTGGLAHDFNNLLTGISGSLELLQSRAAQGRYADIDRYLAAASGACKRAAALTHRLLAFSRQQTLEPKPTDLNRLVAGMEELVRRTIGPEIALEFIASGGLWSTFVDQNQLENALLNLVNNARDAMPAGGRLTVETANKWLDERSGRERDLPAGQYVTLCVSDTGTGMPQSVIERAFDPFFTTKPLGQGTGLGLSMTYGFARQSGGQVRIYSELGHGTTMCIYLPRHMGQEHERHEPAEEAAGARAHEGEAVLVVDDEPTIRMLVAEILEDSGYLALEASDGAAAVKILQSPARIDLLITDVGLPGGMSGRHVAEAGRQLRPGLKVLFITGYAENAVLNHGHLEPGMQVATKPFSISGLARRIRELLSA